MPKPAPSLSAQRLQKISKTPKTAILSSDIQLLTTWQQRLIYLLFFASGISGLALEVSWTRQLGLLLGNTAQSGAIVTAAFFAGMAAGYLLFAKKHVASPLAAYGWCELVVSVWGILSPTLIGAEFTQHLSLLHTENDTARIVARSFYTLLILSPATIAMGATLPLMAAALRHLNTGSVLDTPRAYSYNLLGAVLGAAVSAAFLLQFLGVSRTSYAAAAVSSSCAVVALATQRFFPAASQSRAIKQTSLLGPAAFLAALSGFVTIALQVFYVRALALILHNSVYTFTAVLVVFILALATGSFFAARYQTLLQKPVVIAAVMQLTALLICTTLLFYLVYTGLDYFVVGSNFYFYLVAVMLLVSAVVFPPVAASGILLPASWGFNGKKTSAADIGTLTFLNTIFASAGSLIANFMFLPFFGLWASFCVCAALLVLGSFIFPAARKPASLTYGGAVLIFCIATYFVATKYQGEDRDEKVVQRWESSYGWVDVIAYTDTPGTQLRQNVHYGLGSTGSLTMQRRQAHIPLLLHEDPKKVLFVGLATGTTSGAALDHPAVENVTVLELVPDVIKGAAFFHDFNRGIVSHPKAKIISNDGRYFLQRQKETFAVIVADLFVPWESHTGYLYTEEHFQAVKKNLLPKGIFCQWLPLWQVSENEFHIITNTFAKVFPYASLWYGKIESRWTAVGMVGSEAPLFVDMGLLEKRLAAVPTPHLPKDHSWFSKSQDFLQTYAGDLTYDSAIPTNTDEHPIIEFQAPISAWQKDARLRYDTLADWHTRKILPLPHRNVQFGRGAKADDIAWGEVKDAQKKKLIAD